MERLAEQLADRRVARRSSGVPSILVRFVKPRLVERLVESSGFLERLLEVLLGQLLEVLLEWLLRRVVEQLPERLLQYLVLPTDLFPSTKFTG